MGINCLHCKKFYEKEVTKEISKEEQTNSNFKQNTNQPKSIHSLYNNTAKAALKGTHHNNSKSISYLSAVSVLDINTLSNIDISRQIFNKINDFRLHTDSYQSKAQDHGLGQFFESIKLKLNTERDDCVFIWNDNKYNIADSRQEFDTDKYNVEYISVSPLNFSNSNFSAEEIVWDILNRVTNEEREKIIANYYDSCVVNAKYNNKVLNVELIFLNKKSDHEVLTKV